jgi:hypothetical protein
MEIANAAAVVPYLVIPPRDFLRRNNNAVGAAMARAFALLVATRAVDLTVVAAVGAAMEAALAAMAMRRRKMTNPLRTRTELLIAVVADRVVAAAVGPPLKPPRMVL